MAGRKVRPGAPVIKIFYTTLRIETPDHWFDPAAFSSEWWTEGVFGNAALPGEYVEHLLTTEAPND